MLHFTVRSLRVRVRRGALTVLAVLVGVAMITGTLVFTDTITASFRQLFTGAAQGASVIVSGRQVIGSDVGVGPTIPAALIPRLRALPGVATAQGQVSARATIVGRNGHVITPGRLPTLALSYVGPPFTGLRIVRGSAPRGAHQVAIDERTASSQGYRVGDLVPIVTAEPVRRFRISGIAALGTPSLGGQTFAVFDLPTAQALFGRQGRVDLINVAPVPGFTPDQLVEEIEPLLPAGVVVRSRHTRVDAELRRVGDRLRSLTAGLTAFALVTVVVAALLIFNTFSITATQRAGELALLRALGATRGQVLGAVLLEAGLIGVIGSLAGIAVGPLAAIAIRALFGSGGVALPAGGLVVSARTVLVGLATGVIVALLAAALPAFRATRTAPLEALRASAAPARGRRRVLVRAGVVALLGLGGLLVMLTASGGSHERLRSGAAGGVVLVVAVLVAGPLAVRLLARAVAWPLGRRDAVITELAREHSVQNATRTAISASSLTIGLALVLLVTVYANGLRASSRDAIRQTFVGDIAIENQDGSSPIPSSSVRAAAEIPNAVGLSSLHTGAAHLVGAGDVTANSIEPTTWGQVYRFDWIDGTPATIPSLGIGDAVIEQDTARAAHLAAGDRTTLITGSGQRVPVRIRGIYRDAGLLRGITLPAAWFDQLYPQPELRAVFVRLAPGAGRSAALALLRGVLTAYPGVVARSEAQLAGKVSSTVGSVLALFYALLALSLLMALLGIAGSLNLQVHERTRELGMLRALGMTPDQARSLIRDESLIMAAIGSITGLVLGLILAWALTDALAAQGFVFALPWVQIVAVLAVGAGAGALASLPPGRRVARLDVLAAIAHE
jgi:putative ABC transport system permease protein